MDHTQLKKLAKQFAFAVVGGLFAGAVLATPKMVDYYEATHLSAATLIDHAGPTLRVAGVSRHPHHSSKHAAA